MLRKLRAKIFIAVAFAAIMGVAFSLYANISQLKIALLLFSYQSLPVVLSFVLLNYLLRFLRWEYYLHVLKIEIPRRESLGIFISSLSMAVTPGKMGELVKSYFLKTLHGIPMSKTMPIVFAERVTDFIALLVIAFAGAYTIGYEKKAIIILAILFALGIAVIASRSASTKIIRFVEKFPFVAKRIALIENAYESSRTMLIGKRLFTSTILGFIGWFSECTGFFFVLSGLNIHLRLLSSDFIYAFSTVIGAISFLPGGLGVTETSLAGLLILAKIKKGEAIAAVFISRAATLWFAVLIGTLMLSYMQKRYRVVLNGNVENSSMPANSVSGNETTKGK
jgi:uncharacterized protein (TIRG00374 family)